MKRFVALFLCLMAAFAFGIGASADIIYTPEDDFYAQNADKCSVEDRRYVAAPGSAAQKDPENSGRVFDLESDFEYRVNVTYTDENGTVWGCLEKDNKSPSGWVPMTALSLIYDEISFAEDHGGEFISAEGYSPDLGGGAVVYEYPDSPQRWVYGAGTGFEKISYAEAWKDENGAVWLHVTYYMGIRGWICADNPLAGADDAANAGSEPIAPDPAAPKIENLSPSGEIILDTDPSAPAPVPHVPEKSGAPHKTLWIAVVLTSAAAVLAAVTAVVFVRKRGK